jgi:D-arabinose 1-dehydrogenase-like Zn-dependent alcohol dehydrogenase
MRALVYRGPGEISLETLEDPAPAAGEVLLRVDAAGVCGTDRHIVAGELGVPPGTVPGHEIAGTVVAIGRGVEGWEGGERVACFGQATCGRCPACRAGASNRCRRPAVLGMARQGGFAERVALPEGCLIRLPADIPSPIGAIACDAIATPLHALWTVGGLRAGETVVVIGAGGLGLHAVQLARLAGAACVVAVDPSEAARFAGSELAVMGSFGSTPAEIETVFALIERGRFDVSRSVQREVPLDAAAAIFAQPGGPGRTVIRPQSEALRV